MRLHTRLYSQGLRDALRRAQDKGLIARDVEMTVFAPGRSRTHDYGYEIQLGTYYRHSLPRGYRDQRGNAMNVRRHRNSNHGEAEWAATWHEWGWFIAEIFAADPTARWGADPSRSARPEYAWGYSSPDDFHAKTGGQFRLESFTGAEVSTALRHITEHVIPSS